MWTYLTIFFSLALFLIIFVRRAFLYKRGFNLKKEEKPILIEELPEDKEKIRLSRDEKEDLSGLFKRGETLLESGKDDEAIKCFVQALAINANHKETQQKLALLYLQKQLYGAAAALFEQLAGQTDDAVHYSHLGLALYQQSSFEKAKLAYQKAVELDPSRPQRFVSLAQVYRSLGQGNNAVMALNKALEMDEVNVEFLYLLADLQMELGNFEAAKDILGKILTLNPENKEARVMLRQIKKEE